MQNKNGFTLIELLIVIAILCILATILFPAFQSARDHARRSACLSNEKQLGMALINYLDDNDGNYPMGQWTWNQCPGKGWAGQLYPYFKSAGIMVCPSDPNGSVGVGWSYAYNSYLAGYNQNAAAKYQTVDLLPLGNTAKEWVNGPATVSMLAMPVKTIAIYEIREVGFSTNPHNIGAPYGFDGKTPGSVAAEASAAGDGYAGTQGNNFDNNTNGQFYDMGEPFNLQDAINTGLETYGAYPFIHKAGRHQGGANFLFADGHAKFLLPNQWSGGANMPFQFQSSAYDSEWSAGGGSIPAGTKGASYSKFCEAPANPDMYPFAASVGCATIEGTFSTY